MHRLTIGFWIAGIVLIGLLVYYIDIDHVANSVRDVGWGFLPVLSIRVVLLGIDAHSWRCLLESRFRPSLPLAAFQRWIGESVSTMLPFATIGGELARIRVIIVSGMSNSPAFASVIMDGVVALISQFLFLCVGLSLFLQAKTMGDSLDQSILIGSLTLLAAVIAIWTIVTGRTLGRLANVLKKDLTNDRILWLAEALVSVDLHLARIADNRIAFARSVTWRFLGWALGATEIWLILLFVGHPITVAEALILDSLTAAVRTAFFFVPGGLVVQEGALLAVGAALGADREAMLVAAFIKRAREIFFSIPGLLAWELVESSHLRRTRSEG